MGEEKPRPTKLLCFAMHCVFSTARTKLIEFQTIWIIAPILLGGVVPLLAIITLKCDHRTNIFLLGCHSILPTFFLLNDFGNDTRTDGEAAFTDGELGTLLQRHGHDQL